METLILFLSLLGFANVNFKANTVSNPQRFNGSSIFSKSTQPRLYDIVFSEIMADPQPALGLPEAEYIELFNRSNSSANLSGWKLTVGSRIYELPEVTLPAGEYLVITSKTGISGFAKNIRIIGLFTSSVALVNTGEFLRLENDQGQMICWTEFDDSWYGDALKAKGGWSLEQIDPDNPCAGKTNWTASRSNTGGTPGFKNSVFAENPDNISPDITWFNIPNDTTIEIFFTEPLDTVSATLSQNYYITPDIGFPKTVITGDNHLSSLRISLSHPFSPSKSYTLHITGSLKDCTGNTMDRDISIPVGLSVTPGYADVVINEILFNAQPGGSEYIELYNRGRQPVNTRQLFLGTRNGEGKIENLVRLSETGYFILPGSYLVITESTDKVKTFYPVKDENCFYEFAAMPTLDDKASVIVLLTDSMARVDEVSYSEKMHDPLLRNPEGVSLERIDPEKSSYFPGNWHSAAESAGFGTPGYRNSQFLSDSLASKNIEMKADVFTPDNDGKDDLLEISYSFDKTGCRLQVYIFNANGHLVKRLLNSESVGTKGSFTWDGTNSNGKLCQTGQYIFFIRAVFDDGSTKEYKKSCVLVAK